MASKGVTRIFGNIGFVLPLLLIFFTAAGSAYACPEHRSKAAYRTKAINTRTVSYMAPVVITYGGRCADNIYGTRRVKHVSMMGDGYFEGGARYVAVRNNAPRTRYVTLRDIDYDDVAPRYVAVRRQPVYVEPETRYVAVRNLAPRARYVPATDIDYDDVAPRYVAVRRQPVYVEPETRYVTVPNIAPRARYVPATDIDYDDVAPAASNIDTDFDVETARPKHVVVRTDNLAGTEEVLYSSPSDDTADLAAQNLATRNAVFAPVAYTNGNGVYDDIDINDEAELSDSDMANIAADDMEDTSLPPAVVDTSPELVTTRAVSYVPMDDVDNDVVPMGADVTHVYDDDGHSIRYRPLVDDEDLVDTDTAYVIADDDACDNDVSASTVSYVPISDVDNVDATDVSYLPVESASYIPVEESDLGTVTYMSNDSVVKFDTTNIDADACECPTTVSTLDGEPIEFADSSAILADDADDYAVAELDNRNAVVATTGYENTLNETDGYSYASPDPYLESDSDEIEHMVE